MERQFFRKYTTKELFTEYIFELMKERRTFMIFPDNNQILIDIEVYEWNTVNGIYSKVERLIYCPINKGYVVTDATSITNVTIPFELFDLSYEEFIQAANEC